ncbi:hypothetical protein C0989_006479 [Termitomyces sp. Mn162]|nr:hypothetical protein C0989_006479 [Termitomyces sp. Mn162]
MLAPTLAPIAEAEEPNDDEAAQPKEDESKMDCTTAVTTTVGQSAIADDSALISNPVATVTDSDIPTGPIAATGQLIDVDMTGPAPSHALDEIVPQCGHSASHAT